MRTMHRTQFDPQLLFESVAPLLCRNHGRQIVVRADGSVITVLAWGGESPVLRVWKEQTQIGEHLLSGPSSAPCLLADGNGATLWLSVNDKVCVSSRLTEAPVPIGGCEGSLEDVASDEIGRAS